VFTGLVQAIGTVVRLESGRLSLAVPDAWPGEPCVIGESLSVSGCCLTVVSAGATLEFDLSDETLARSNLGGLTAGSKVNLERAMRATDRFGGHIVQGHVDTVCAFKSRREDGVFTFEVDGEFRQFLVDKGSIALDGVSLTVVQPEDGRFSVAVIPHTLQATTLGALKPGDKLNVEFDILAKYALNPR
jgi:riboflavin synthase